MEYFSQLNHWLKPRPPPSSLRLQHKARWASFIATTLNQPRSFVPAGAGARLWDVVQCQAESVSPKPMKLLIRIRRASFCFQSVSRAGDDGLWLKRFLIILITGFVRVCELRVGHQIHLEWEIAIPQILLDFEYFFGQI